MTSKNNVRLSHFILDQMEPILQEWENFAKTIEPPAFTMDSKALRNHASLMLKAIAFDLDTPQTTLERAEKSKGRGPQGQEDTAAETHAVARLESGYTINQLVSEYRALRASVLYLWSERLQAGLSTDGDDVTRFNEAVDQALAESVARYAQITAHAAETARQRLDAVLESAPAGIGLADIQGKLILSNPENKRIWGNHPMSGNVDEYVEWKGWWADGSEKHGQLLAPHEWALARALSGEEAPRDIVEIEPFDAPDLRRTIVLHAAPIRDVDKNTVGAVVAQMDITDRIKTEISLRETASRLQFTLDAAQIGDWDLDLVNDTSYRSLRHDQCFGYSEPIPDWGFENFIVHVHPEDRIRVQQAFEAAISGLGSWHFECRVIWPDGSMHWIAGHGSVYGTDGKPTRMTGIVVDITIRKQAEENLKESDRRKDEFLAMLAHELRNPLAPISTAAELIRRIGTDEKRMHQASDIISRQVKHMTNLVDDLLDVSRVTRGLTELDKETLELKTIVHSAVEQARPLIEARHHELHLRITPAPVYLLGDKTRLVQVIVNLLNNAAKYTPQGGEITLALEAQTTQAKISVSDNGNGIAPSFLPHVFDLFTQGERTPDRAQGGLGLGLALVKSITSLHGGHVEASSEGIGKGSAFAIVFPMHKNEKIQLGDAAQPRLVPQMTKSVRLMIVDDNLDAAQSLASLLEAEGHQVIVAEDAHSALESVETDPVPVFILDIGLPDMDGYELARRLRVRSETADSTLIALTGYGQAHDRILSKAAGFDYHFVKPIDSLQLTSILAHVT